MTGEALEADRGQKMIQAFPRRRVMAPGDLDGMLVFLGSDAARAVTGSVVVVDDGQSL
jgi:enoyl-[acyl-carrier-protein] reductase (NADH)